MKTKYILKSLVILLFVFTATAQQGINYKAMIKDANGGTLVNTTVTVQFTILENGTTDVFKETHNPTTDANGIIIVNIGEGSVVSGAFNDIDWGSNPHFLNTKIDSGDGLTDMGTTEFKTVPYALHALNSSGATKLDELSDAKFDGSSVFIGLNAGLNDDGTNNYNSGMGFEALKNNTTGHGNTAIGYHSLSNNTDGMDNSALGFEALYSNIGGIENTALGIYTLRNNTTGNRNTAIGKVALEKNTVGIGNTANGFESLRSNTTGRYNTALGLQSLTANVDGFSNTALGYRAGFKNTGSRNIFIGFTAGAGETGDDKLYIENSNSGTPLIGGDFAKDSVVINGSLSILDGTQGNNKVLTSNAEGKASWQTSTTGTTELNDLSDAKTSEGSVFIGEDAGINDDGTNNNSSAFGFETLKNNTTGYGNTAIGYRSLINNTEGGSNTALGVNALYFNEVGMGNIALGPYSLRNNIAGLSNIAIGYQAGYYSTGSRNIFIGYDAGKNEKGNDKLYIENTDSSTPLIGGNFALDEITINGDLEVTKKITAHDSGNADMKAYIYGFIDKDGDIYNQCSTQGFNVNKIGRGIYEIIFTGINKPSDQFSYIVTATADMLVAGDMNFPAVMKTNSDSFRVFIKNINESFHTDGGFSFVVYKK